MAICFDCWKLVKITDEKPKKTYFSGWRRYGYEIKPEDLMKHHWDNKCFKTNKHIEACLLASSKSEILHEKSSDWRGYYILKKIHLIPSRNLIDQKRVIQAKYLSRLGMQNKITYYHL